MFSSYAGHKAPRLLDFGLDIKAEAHAVAVAGGAGGAAAVAAHGAKVRGVGQIGRASCRAGV